MNVIRIDKNLKDEPGFGPSFKNRIKEKLKKNVINDPEVNLFRRISALT